MSTPEGSVALLGDAHLREDDGEVEAFVRFLDHLPESIGTLVILGDLFAVWIGRAELTRSHHARVLEALRRLRNRGCRLLYIEGNHDFFLSRLYRGDPFETVVLDSLDLTLGGKPVHLCHGDLVNSRDRQYLAWRRISKHRLFFRLFNLLPAALRGRIIEWLERSLAGTNLAYRGVFPETEFEAYARTRVRDGREVLVFGHFHEEKRFDYVEGGRRGTVFVLPAWRESHRYLLIVPGREPAFVSS